MHIYTYIYTYAAGDMFRTCIYVYIYIYMYAYIYIYYIWAGGNSRVRISICHVQFLRWLFFISVFFATGLLFKSQAFSSRESH